MGRGASCRGRTNCYNAWDPAAMIKHVVVEIVYVIINVHKPSAMCMRYNAKTQNIKKFHKSGLDDGFAVADLALNPDQT